MSEGEHRSVADLRIQMRSPWAYDRIMIRILAFLTIAPSIYLQNIVKLHRSLQGGKGSR